MILSRSFEMFFVYSNPTRHFGNSKTKFIFCSPMKTVRWCRLVSVMTIATDVRVCVLPISTRKYVGAFNDFTPISCNPDILSSRTWKFRVRRWFRVRSKPYKTINRCAPRPIANNVNSARVRKKIKFPVYPVESHYFDGRLKTHTLGNNTCV